ncbi:hypothetical protein GJAV_G00239220 [Gymnothorax javanicus]|nr:hypothetical protein GJAV_G00239220 [Gymnothorax javanicus]
MRIEGYEERLLRLIRTPLDRDDLEESVRRIMEQEALQLELDRLKEDLDALKERCEAFVSHASASHLAPTLSSELSVLLQSMSQVYSMSSVYLEKLRSMSLVVKHSQVAENLVKKYEAKLSEEEGVSTDSKSIESVITTLKQWRSEIDDSRAIFHDLEDELQKARAISDRMFKTHNERDFDLDWHKEKADQLNERWRNVNSQIESRLRDLESIGKSLRYYRDSYRSLDEWICEMEANQLSMQENQPEDSKALAELLNQQKVLVSEIEEKQSRIEECQKYSEHYSAAVKDYELQLMTYMAMVDSQHKSPIKRRRMQSSSDAILQEFMDLRTRYTALVTLMTQYVKFASETLKRTEEEEKSIEEEKKEHGDKVSKLLGWMSSAKASLSKEEKCLRDGKNTPDAPSKPQISVEELATKKEQVAEALRTTQLLLTKHSDKMTEKEKQETKDQLKSLHQAYSELSQKCSEQTPSTQQECQVIEGLLDVRSGKVYSVCQSMQVGLIDETTGLRLLEAQLITSGLVLLELRVCLDLDNAFHHNLVNETTYKKLQDLNQAHRCILAERYASEPLPVIAALREGAVSEDLAMKLIEIQLATGGLRLTYTGDILNLEEAFEYGLVPPSLFIRTLERLNNWKDLIDPNTAEKVSLVQLIQRSLIHEETGLRLLPVKRGQEGIISLKSGKEMSILRAVHEGLIDRETMFRLLGAQLFAGGIVDPKTSRKLTVEEALSEGLIDQDTASGVLSYQMQNGGIVNPRNGERLTVDQAVQCNLISSSSALLVLERQKGFVGLVWPQSGEILTVTTSLQHEIITEQLAIKLLNNRQKVSAFYIPENSEVIDIDCAAKEGFIDRYTADVLKTIEIPDVFPDIDALNLRFSTWLSMRELQIEGSHQPEEDLGINEKSINRPSPTEAKQLFISYLMMNSYMDPKSEDETSSDSVDKDLHPKTNNIASHSDWPVVQSCTSPLPTMEQSSDTEGRASIGLKPQPSSALHSLKITPNTIEMLTMPVKSRKTVREPLKDYQEDQPECLHPEGLQREREEREHAVLLLKAQVEEGGILDVTSGERYDLDAAIEKGLVDENTAFEVLASQFSEQIASSGKQHTGPIFTLREASAMRSISPLSALRIMERRHLLRGFYDSESGKTISISEALEQGLITDDLAEKVLNSAAVQDGIISPNGGPINRNSETIILEHSYEANSDSPFNDQAIPGNLGSKEVATTNFNLNGSQLAEKRADAHTEPPSSSMPSLHEVNQSSMTDSRHKGRGEEPSIENSLPKLTHLPEFYQGEEMWKESPGGAGKLLSSLAEPCDMEIPKSGDSLDSGGFDESAGEITWLASETPKDSDVIVSQRAMSMARPPAVYSTLQDRLYQVVTMIAEGVHGDNLQKMEMQAIKDIIGMLQDLPDEQFLNQGGVQDSGLAVPKKDLPPRPIDSTSPDLLIDLIKQEAQCSDIRKQLCHQGTSFEAKPTEGNLPANIQQIQHHLMQIIQAVSSSGDPTILKGVLQNLGGSLDSDSLENKSEKMKSTEKGETVAAAEGGEDPDTHQGHSVEISSHLQTQDPDTENQSNDVSEAKPLYTTQNYLECIGRLQDHADFIEEIRNDSEAQNILSNNIEELQSQLEENKAHLELSYQDLLRCLQQISGYVYDSFEKVSNLDVTSSDNLDTVKYIIQQNKDIEKSLSSTQQQLENTAFEVQFFISEHAQNLSPAHSKQLLLALTSTQRAFKELSENISAQRSSMELHLERREEQRLQKDAAEKQREYSEKLQELCDSLTQTENRLIGHQQLASTGNGVGDLQQYQKEHQALQKDVQANASALTEVLSSTRRFLEENRSKLRPEQVTAIESQLEEAKAKARLLSQRAEESGKELEKVLTTAIKQETEKVAAVEQLEESKNKIEGLLDWISNIGKDREKEKNHNDPTCGQNGNEPLDVSPQGIIGEQDDNNGNLLTPVDNITAVDGEREATQELDLDEQYNRIKARHQEVLSQQQELIMATQSAQALLDRQAHALSPSERDKLQRDIQELRGRYDSELAEAELQAKLVQSLREEVGKFKEDCGEFEAWLGEAEGEAGDLGAPADRLDVLADRLERQKSFAEDVISHKGDLRFITVLGQKVLDAARSCGRGDPTDRNSQTDVDTTGVCTAVKDRLDTAAGRYKAVHSQCNQLGSNLKDVVERYRKYQDAAGGLQDWLNSAEKEAARQQSEPIAADPQTLQKQLEETKALQAESSGRQASVDALRKTADALISSEGDLLTNQDEILETVDEVAERYDGLSKVVSERHEKLQVTLTRSLSVQDGLDEMLHWMDGVEESLRREEQIPPTSTAIGDALSKEAALEQDLASRQSSMATMKAKLKTFAETADPSAASSLRAKMDTLSRRFSDASAKHKEKVARLEQLRDKVELFERTSEKVQQFVTKRSQDLSETEGPGKNVDELSQLMKDTNAELLEHTRDVEELQKLSKELCESGPESSRAQVQGHVEHLAKGFKALTESVKEREEEVSSCQDQLAEFRTAAQALRKWLEEVGEKVPVLPASCSEQSLAKALQSINVLIKEWTAKGMDVQDINTKGSALCSLISVLTSPAKTKTSRKHGSAVTNGSGPGAHAYLTNKELMVVRQDMTYINEGYEALGERLKGRAGELDVAVRTIREAREEADSVAGWLRDMKNTLTSWDAVSTETDSMKTQMEKQKAFEEDMAQKQGQLEKLRGSLQELVELYPDSPDAAGWKQALEQIDTVWKELKDLAEERRSQLEKSSHHMTQFQTAEAQLRQWLSEKELMMSVLGPLSVDPNMLIAQKQQVQILLNEFEGRKPQYDQMKEAAQAILSEEGTGDSSREDLREKQAAITQKWEWLTGELGRRSGRIDQASGKTGSFQGLLKGLTESTADLESRLLSQSALSTQPDAVKRQLEAANEVSAQLREERKKLQEAESLCAELSGLVEEEYLKADLSRQLETVAKPFKQLEMKASQRIEQLTSAFASSQQFQQMSKDFLVWLEERRQEGAIVRPVWAQSQALRRGLEEQDVLLKELGEQEQPYHAIVRDGEALLRSTEGAERVALEGKLASLRSCWEEVKKGASERSEQLQSGLQRALRFEEQSQRLRAWADECSAKVGAVQLSVDPAVVERSALESKALQREVDKQRGLVELLSSAADGLLEVATEGREEVRQEAAAAGQVIDTVAEELQQKKDALETLAQGVKEFSDTQKEAQAQLEAARKQVEAQASLGAQLYSNKNLTNMKAQQRALSGLQTQVEHLKGVAQGLVVDVPDAEGVTDLLLQADSLEQDYGSVRGEVDEKCATLEAKLQGVGHFQNGIREMFSRFADLDDELDGMAPVGRDQNTLQTQHDAIEGFLAELQGLIADVAGASTRCKQMLEVESSPDLPGLRRDLEALTKQSGKLMDRARTREEQIEAALARVDEFYNKLERFSEKLGGAEEREESQGPVGMETEVINQQLEAFKVFQKEEIEPLQAILQDLNWLGQGLVQSAAKNTDTQSLEQDLENVNTRWNSLNKKIAERSAQLHEALLHCGRFQDALESLLSWLRDTEELVANQKPPSAEFKVVKAQIQEQKLLQRLLYDRRPTVELIKREGGKMSDLAEPADREKIVREISNLGQRWDTLLRKAETRYKQLENTLGVAQQFHETLEPLVEWLSATEKRLANAEPVGTQTKKLEEQIAQHKSLEAEVTGHGKDLHQAVSLGQTLRSMSSQDDKELVQARLDGVQAGYLELQDCARQRGEMLQQACANAQLFGEDEVALMTWLSEVHARLAEVAVQDYNTDVLEKQCAEQLALHEDIELRKQNVDQAVSNGMELLKQTTGDEVVVIQGKLDGIKSRYSEINSMSAKVSATLDKALSLATRLQRTHEDLNQWLDGVEEHLEAYQAQDPVGEQLTHVQERQKELLQEVRERRVLVDSLNETSSGLLELVPWRVREGLDKLVSDDNERYKMAADTVAQHVDQIDAAILKSQQFEQAADTELAWLVEAERKLLSLGPIRLEQNETVAQLQTQKVFSMDILRHKDAVDSLVKTGEAIAKNKDEEEKQTLQEKIGALQEKYGVVSLLNSERRRSGFDQLPPPAIEYDTLKQQQEELRQMRELIAEHKPHIDKMNKTGPQLLELSPVEGQNIRQKYTATDQLYAHLKADVKQRAGSLDEALSKSTQFHDKIDPMLESLERIVERLRQPPSISVEVEKIREQISENKAVSVDLEKLQPGYETLKQRGEEMIARSEGADKDISAKAVQDKLDHMVFLWSDIQALLEEREAKLLDVMDLADKFWCDHGALMVTIKDTQDLLREMEGPGVDPSVVKQQQETMESFKEEIDGLQEEQDVVQNLGSELMAACGEPDKPVIKKSIDEVNSAWETLNKAWKEQVDRLEEAMQAAVQFQDGLQGMFDWLDIVESKLDSMPPVGTDLETVKQQIEELKEFKSEAYQLQIEMERLNHQGGLLLKKAREEEDRTAIQEPLSELKMLWDNLDEKTINRQHKLEGALLALGQFQHALDELLTWLTHTEELLNEQRQAVGDPKAIEIELAKHHVLQNDVLAHKTTVEAVNKAGSDLMQSSAGEEASSLQGKLENLNQRWQNILEKTALRRQLLDSALLQAQGFHGEIEDMQQWLKDTERQLLASKALGGLPETAREQLNAHLELCSAFQTKEELYQDLMRRGQQLLSVAHEGQDNNTEQDLRHLQEKWDSVQARLDERKVKLEEALTLATEFHNSLQDFINWLTQAEQTLTMASPASLIMETVMFQIDEHKVFVTEVNSHREQVIELDKRGTHLKYFSQKQDVVLIKNLLISVQSRWEKVVQRSVERGRVLDDARKRAKQFYETWSKLSEWLEESEKALDAELEIANEPDKIKQQLAQHKEFQKALGSKHSVYDTTSRTGRALKDKTSLEDDHQRLDDMLSELRDKWDTVCGKSVERQNKLEEALLFAGQFTDALQALIDWLYKVEPQLAEDQPVHGDIDLVLNLIDNHKVFQKELGKRTGSVQALKRSARELIENRHDDSSWVKVQMQELSTRWETVCALSVSKQTRLEQALCQAEEFHSTVHILLEWLAEAEQSLRFHGALPDDEEALRSLIEQHKEFMKKLEEKRTALTKATSMGEAILAICHPDSITTIKHWNTIIKARFEEVQAWARQHLQRLGGALNELLATLELLETLLGWLQWAETTLNQKDKDPLPQEIEEVKALIAEHQTFMEEMTRKQPDVDKVTKTHKRKVSAEVPVQSQIPVLEKGRTARKRSPSQGLYPPTAPQPQIDTKNPRVNLLVSKWQQVWLLALDRRRKLNDALDRLEELKEFANFDFDVWRKRYMRWMNHKKSRVMDFFRRIDKDQDGKVTRQEFIDGILSSKFPTSRLEMSAVADIFDRDGDGYIDYYEFVAALHPNKDAYKPLTDADKIEDEVTRQVAKCKCPKRFQVEQIGANKYRFYLGNQFGDSQQLRLVRILRSTVMVRVGGGWMALDEFLVKNDPCRAKGRTNVELREKFIGPEGSTQVMASFRYRGRRSRPSSRAASPNRSNSSQSCPAHPNPVVTSTPKTSQHLTRNYDKPWLTNSKPCTPLKSSDSFESQGSSSEATPIQGSKLRLPGYLSGKGFQSGEDGSLISAAVTKARSQLIERKTPSRPGSKAGSRGSSRRGSDASDFDISDIQSVCSDTSEAPPESVRERTRASPRPHTGKPSKIPTPQRRSQASSKLARPSKR